MAREADNDALPRVARIVIPGQPHHVVQRGDNRQDVFFVNDDRHATGADPSGLLDMPK